MTGSFFLAKMGLLFSLSLDCLAKGFSTLIPMNSKFLILAQIFSGSGKKWLVRLAKGKLRVRVGTRVGPVCDGGPDASGTAVAATIGSV